MKTTIDIADPIFQRVKEQAVIENTTFKLLVEQGLRLVLDRNQHTARPFRLKPLKTQGGGLQPEFQGADWPTFRDAIYEERPR